MSDLDDLLAELNGDDTLAEKSEDATPEIEVKVEDSVPDEKAEDPLAGLLVGETSEPAPEPVKKRRGRPKGSATKKKEPEVTTEASTEIPPLDAGKITVDGDPEAPSIQAEAVVASVSATLDPPKPKDIYILTEAQIFNGHVYRRGQKITFTPGDKFYQSQTDRNGNNWLDHIDDPAYQFAHFGRLLVRAESWNGTPFGSTEGVDNPALALAIARIAQEEHERNGRPY